MAVGIAAITYGQKQAVKTLFPTSVQRVESSTIDTKDFVVQIDESYNYQPLWPENPIDRFDPPAKPNNLPVGKMSAKPVGTPGPLFPAIGATGWTPPDPDIAVGPNHILAVVNSSFAWFDKAGTKQFQQTAQNFFTGMGAGSFQFDPKCFFDRVHQRFVFIYLEQDDATVTSKILLAVSDDADPNGTWFRYRLEAKLVIGTASYWLDYPGFGYNKDAFVVSGNMFGFTSGFAGIQFLVVPSLPLLTGGAATVTSIRDATLGSAQVAEMISATAPNVFAIARNGSTSVRLYSVNDPGGTPTVSQANIAVPSNSSPTMDATSTNSRTLDTIDGRVFNATWRNGKLVAAHNRQNGSFVGSRWYQIDTNGFPSGTPTVGHAGNIGSATEHLFDPAISINGDWSISTLYTRCSPTVTADLVFSGRNRDLATGTIGAPVLLEASAGNSYGQGRWGDYFGVDVDPVNDRTFWGIGMLVAANNSWTTSIFSWNVTPPAQPNLVSFVIEPVGVQGGQPTSGIITLDAPALAGGSMFFMSKNSDLIQIPDTVTVPSGETTVTFTIQTSVPIRNTTVSVKASSEVGAIKTAMTVLH